MRMRKKPNLEVRMQRCSALLVSEPEQKRGRWRSLMPEAAALHIELGCGKGRFTAGTAAAHPDILFIAVERVPDAMIRAVERAAALGLCNVFFVDGDAAKLTDYFAPGEADRIYLNFCDPWPSNRHAKRRMTHPDFLMRYRVVLREGGEIHFKTDNRSLFDWSLLQFSKTGYAVSELTRDLHAGGICGVMTDYEEKFHGLGVPINRCVAAKTPAAQSAAREDRTEPEDRQRGGPRAGNSGSCGGWEAPQSEEEDGIDTGTSAGTAPGI